MHRPCTQRRVWHNLGLQKTQTERLNDKLPTMWQGVRVRCVYLKSAKPVKLVSLLPVRSPAKFLETGFLALGQVQQRLRVESLPGFDPQGGPCKPKCASTRLYAHPVPHCNLILSDYAYSLQISKVRSMAQVQDNFLGFLICDLSGLISQQAAAFRSLPRQAVHFDTTVTS